ncbi:DNA-binding NarL/FixJ family response regulator [Friedmanniella endophytica]|uniref:DNA-binding NarL/FixJ family response regulator n=1 Tax=Microlunatus kandeliicorticis TaxID=1759536 RepID=A0A7W3IS75_9ACTN|nr:response regulator transcription factor [Microlunatus kandeliicorticis]MBA8794287.1 DNA-binding NarL/FixJ family response regulator [Microlunatus kandeliicorticis]
MSEPIRVLVADDQDIVRDGLVTVLGLLDDLEVVGSAADGRAAVELCRSARPDVVLMDLRMPVLDGADATAALLAEQPEVAVLVLTTYADDTSIARALRAGARGYLTKDASREDIAVAIRAVARGQATFDPVVSARLISGLAAAPGPTQPSPATPSASGPVPGRPTDDPRTAELTAREREVLRLIGEGLSNTEIAERLFVSTSTVKTHINNLFAKLRLRDRPHAVRLALEVFGDR